MPLAAFETLADRFGLLPGDEVTLISPNGAKLTSTGYIPKFRHFEVTLAHDTSRVTGISMEARRWPWATCPEAGANLHGADKVDIRIDGNNIT